MALRVISHFNDWAQARLFNGNKLAPEFPESAITKPFPFNGYYSESEAPEVDGDDYKLEIGGLVDNKKSWTLPELNKLPEVSQITRHICVEGWSAIGSWQGVKLSEFLKMIGADTTAKYVWFQCAEGYSNTIDMPTALHPQTQLTLQVRSPDAAAQVRLPDQDPHPDQARIQESEIRHRDVGAEQRRRRLLGEPGLQLVQRAVAELPRRLHRQGRALSRPPEPWRAVNVAGQIRRTPTGAPTSPHPPASSWTAPRRR